MYGKDGRWYHVRRRSVGRQLEVYRYIQAYADHNGYPPTVREIAGEVHVTEATARGYLKALESAGLVKSSGSGTKVFMLSEMEDYGSIVR